MSVTKQNQIEHIDCLNLQLKLKEEKEYWEDKLLELKLKNCKTNFIEEKSSQNLKSKLSSLQSQNASLKQKISELKSSIAALKSSEKNKESKLSAIDTNISISTKTNQDLQNQIKSLKEYLVNFNITDNIVNHILTFDEEFRKKIYNICSERVNYVLQFNTPMGYPQQQVKQPMPSMPHNYMYGYGPRPMMMYYPPQGYVHTNNGFIKKDK